MRPAFDREIEVARSMNDGPAEGSRLSVRGHFADRCVHRLPLPDPETVVVEKPEPKGASAGGGMPGGGGMGDMY